MLRYRIGEDNGRPHTYRRKPLQLSAESAAEVCRAEAHNECRRGQFRLWT
jgi:hypothetical protein